MLASPARMSSSERPPSCRSTVTGGVSAYLDHVLGIDVAAADATAETEPQARGSDEVRASPPSVALGIRAREVDVLQWGHPVGHDTPRSGAAAVHSGNPRGAPASSGSVLQGMRAHLCRWSARLPWILFAAGFLLPPCWVVGSFLPMMTRLRVMCPAQEARRAAYCCITALTCLLILVGVTSLVVLLHV